MTNIRFAALSSVASSDVSSVEPVPVLVNAGARLDRLPMSAFHRTLLWTIGLSVFFDFFDASMAGALVGGLLSSHWSTLTDNTLFLAATGAGGVLGNVLVGWLADRFGRRPALRSCLLLVGVTTLISAGAPSMPWLIALRFLSCVGIAAIPTVGFCMLAEFLPPRIRGRWSTFGGAVANSAIIFASLAGYLLIPHGAWRWMFVIPGIASLVLWRISRRMPESPRWLEAVGRTGHAELTLRMLESEAAKSAKGVLPPPQVTAGTSEVATASARSFLRRPMLGRLLFGIIIALGANVAIAGFLTWLPTMLLREGLSISSSLGRNLLITAGTPLGALLGALLADRLGRRRGLISVAGSAIVLALVFSMATAGIVSILSGFALLTALAFVVNVIYAVYLPEMFPTTLRVQGTAIAAATTKIAFIALPFAMAALLTSGGPVAAMMLIEACLITIALSVALFGSETAYHSLEVTSAPERPTT